VLWFSGPNPTPVTVIRVPPEEPTEGEMLKRPASKLTLSSEPDGLPSAMQNLMSEELFDLAPTSLKTASVVSTLTISYFIPSIQSSVPAVSPALKPVPATAIRILLELGSKLADMPDTVEVES
jgi:hypothetical protein